LLIGVIAVLAVVLCKVLQWFTIKGLNFQSIGLALLDKMRNVSLFVAAGGVISASIIADANLRLFRGGGHRIESPELWEKQSAGDAGWRWFFRVFAIASSLVCVALMFWAWRSATPKAGWLQTAPPGSCCPAVWVFINRVEQIAQILLAPFSYLPIILVRRVTSFVEHRIGADRPSPRDSRMANEAFFAVTLAVALNPIMCWLYFLCLATAKNVIAGEQAISFYFGGVEYADTATSVGCFFAYWIPFLFAWLWMWWRYSRLHVAPSLATLVRDFWRGDLSAQNEK